MSCNTCPFACTEEAEQVQNYGCLPTPFLIVQMLKQHNAIWGCHCTSKKDNNLKACSGFLEYLKRNKTICDIDMSEITGKEEIIDYSQWASDDEYYLRFKIG